MARSHHKKRKKAPGINAQVSLEHIMVVAIAMIVLIPVVYLFYSYTQKSTAEVNLGRMYTIGRNIVHDAESIYYLGPPSKVTREENMPEGVVSIEILQDPSVTAYELVFHLADDNSVVIPANVPINGTFGEESTTKGLKLIGIQSMGGYVNITFE